MPKINTRSQEWYGWLPDLPDHRDLMYSAIKPVLAQLPDKATAADSNASDRRKTLARLTPIARNRFHLPHWLARRQRR
jgi:hypothetical protein